MSPYTKLVVVLILSSVITMLLIIVISKASNEQEQFYSNIGKHIVIKTDTLLIVDASYIGKTYTLSNGAKLNHKMIIRSTIIE